MSDEEGTQTEYVTKADLEEMISRIIKANPVHDDDEEEETETTSGPDVAKTLREVEEWSKKLVEEAVNTLKKEMKATPKPKPTVKVEDDTPKEPVGEQTPVTPGKKKWGERFWG